MTNPNHRLKKFVRYVGDDKPASSYITDASGWLGSGVKDCNGVEIFEGDAVILDNRLGVVRFDNAQFYIDRDGDEDVPFTLNRLCSPFIKVIGHIADGES